MTDPDAVVVEIEGRIVRGNGRVESFGWKLSLPQGEDPAQAAAHVTDLCKRVRDEAQAKLKLSPARGSVV